jgi:hypothetical protein
MPEMTHLEGELPALGVGRKSRLHLDKASADAPSALLFHGFALDGFVAWPALFAVAGLLGDDVAGFTGGRPTCGWALSAGRGAVGAAGGLVVWRMVVLRSQRFTARRERTIRP